MNIQPKIISEITERFKRYPHVEKVILYGSRARGDEEDRSDIDIAVSGPVTDDEWRGMRDYIEEEARTLLAVDIVRLEKVSDKIKNSIDREGVTLYERH